MSLHRTLVLTLLLGAAGLLPTFGQSIDITAHGGVSRLSNRNIGSFVDQNAGRVNALLDDGFRLGFRVGLASGRFRGYEFGYAYSRTALVYQFGTQEQKQGFGVHQAFLNYLLYVTPEGTRIRPFVTGGGHFSNYVPPGVSALRGGGDNKFGFNYGGGVKVKLTDLLLMRVDYRQFRNPKPFQFQGRSGWLNQNEISIGFGIGL